MVFNFIDYEKRSLDAIGAIKARFAIAYRALGGTIFGRLAKFCSKKLFFRHSRTDGEVTIITVCGLISQTLITLTRGITH